MNIQKLVRGILTLLLFSATSALANNFTVSGAFDGTEAMMAADPKGCGELANTAKRYRIAGTITVSTTGEYTVVDAGNWFSTYLTQGDIADLVVMVYAGSFDAASPSSNQVGSIDGVGTFQLDAGTSYIVVVQHWCEETIGAYAVVIDGAQATISGDGFASPPVTMAELDGGSPSAFFADLNGNRRYKSEAVTVSNTGLYYYVDVGEELGGNAMSLRIYEGSFDPQNTNSNLVFNSEGIFIGYFSLEAGINYEFVLVESSVESEYLQYVLYPPGPFNFNPGLNGAWVAEEIKAQGILMEVLPVSGALFFAHFTFPEQAVAVTENTSRLSMDPDADGSSDVPNSIGSDDQVWLTAFGALPASGNYMTIKYENSTGGRFNSEDPDAVTDSNYGTGWIEGISCNHLIINWNLPGGVVDTRDWYKGTQDAVPYCQSLIKAGPVSPQW